MNACCDKNPIPASVCTEVKGVYPAVTPQRFKSFTLQPFSLIAPNGWNGHSHCLWQCNYTAIKPFYVPFVDYNPEPGDSFSMAIRAIYAVEPIDPLPPGEEVGTAYSPGYSTGYGLSVGSGNPSYNDDEYSISYEQDRTIYTDFPDIVLRRQLYSTSDTETRFTPPYVRYKFPIYFSIEFWTVDSASIVMSNPITIYTSFGACSNSTITKNECFATAQLALPTTAGFNIDSREPWIKN